MMSIIGFTIRIIFKLYFLQYKSILNNFVLQYLSNITGKKMS